MKKGKNPYLVRCEELTPVWEGKSRTPKKMLREIELEWCWNKIIPRKKKNSTVSEEPLRTGLINGFLENHRDGASK